MLIPRPLTGAKSLLFILNYTGPVTPTPDADGPQMTPTSDAFDGPQTTPTSGTFDGPQTTLTSDAFDGPQTTVFTTTESDEMLGLMGPGKIVILY